MGNIVFRGVLLSIQYIFKQVQVLSLFMNDDSSSKTSNQANSPSIDVERLRSLPPVRRLLRRMPKEIAHQFTAEQLHYLHRALNKKPAKHGLDLDVNLPFIKNSYFVRLRVGRNRRHEKRRATGLADTLATAIAYTLGVTVLIVFLYLLKSFLGIDIFSGYSLGII